MLLEHGAKVNVPGDIGWTPLHRAASYDNVQLVRLLLEHGADVNARDRSGKTPSQLATQQEVVEVLSEYGVESVK
jgi:ankyrin repeat protein